MNLRVIIFERDCYRYALMWEVAAFKAGNFHGVCPILNRATHNLIPDEVICRV